jgi:hypothetical protein
MGPAAAPPDSSAVTVTVDGTPATGWSYDAAANTVVFGAPPPPGSIIEVTYRRGCG